MLKDKTVERNFLAQVANLIDEYELIKAGKHSRFRFVTDFYQARGIKRQNFIKYYNRFRKTSDPNSLLPCKRGRKFGSMKYQPYIQNKIAELRQQGFGRYEIFDLMLPEYGSLTPSPSTIYNILVRKGLGKLDPRMIQTSKRKIIKEKAGQLGHFDCHRLAKGILQTQSTKDQLYMLSLVDDFTRVSFGLIIPDLTALTVSMGALKLFSVFHQVYNIQFQEVLTDNGSEFGRRESSETSKHNHPFERLLQEKNIKHRYTKPYRPQTNGKVERYWRTLEEELLREQVWETQVKLEEELLDYMVYYNHLRRHQGIKNITPYEQLNSVSE